jgi:hypothetical protein
LSVNPKLHRDSLRESSGRRAASYRAIFKSDMEAGFE